jgi:hypothetical protein
MYYFMKEGQMCFNVNRFTLASLKIAFAGETAILDNGQEVPVELLESTLKIQKISSGDDTLIAHY